MSRPCPICHVKPPSGAVTCPLDGAALEPSLGGRETPKELDLPPDIGAEPTAIRDPLIGMKLDQYQVTGRLGEGGMGVVYRAVQPVIGKEVAIKVLKPHIAEDPIAVKRLLEEARAVNAIRHRGIIDIFGFGELDSGQQYVVMELLQGQPLDELLRQRGRLSPAEAAEILDEALSALEAAHGAGVIHRDLKPNNIFLASIPGAPRFVKLLDFGLVKRDGARSGGALTQVNMTVGTPEYIAPEQAHANPVSPRTDLYAIGVIAFELLSGRLPFVEATAMDYLRAHTGKAPPRLSTLVEVPPALEEWVARLLEKDPERRPASAEKARSQLAQALASEPAGAVPAEPSARVRASGPKRALATGFRPAVSAATGQDLRLAGTGRSPSETEHTRLEPAPTAPRAAAAQPRRAPDTEMTLRPPDTSVDGKLSAVPGSRRGLRLWVTVLVLTLVAVAGVVWGKALRSATANAPEEPPGVESAPGLSAVPAPGAAPAVVEPEPTLSDPPPDPATDLIALPSTPVRPAATPRRPRPAALDLERQRQVLLSRIDALSSRAQTSRDGKPDLLALSYLERARGNASSAQGAADLELLERRLDRLKAGFRLSDR